MKTQYEPIESIRARQTERMRAIVEHAYNTCRFWKDRFDACGIKPSDIRELDDLQKLPILTKDDLRKNVDSMLSSQFNDKTKLDVKETSGSTGIPLIVYVDQNTSQFKRGVNIAFDEWSGWRIGERVAALWSTQKTKFKLRSWLRQNLLSRNYVFLDTLKMDEIAIHEFTNAMVRTPPSLIFGHAHSFYLFARFLKYRRPEVKIRPKGIITTAMVLLDHERPLIEEVFDCKVINRYGCEEVSLIACECKKQEGLHVNLESLHVELIDFEGNSCPPGTPGHVIVTDLHNRAMPILRYAVGDTATWKGTPCSCGRTFPLFTRIEGRIADYVLTSKGEYVSGISLTSYFACMLPGVTQIQIIQEELDKFVFNIVKDPDFDEKAITILDDLIKKRFGENTRYELVFMDRIPQDKSGKFRFCISKVKKDLFS
ncbi:MAG: phenylacetate--CoA ligase family protein [Thermoguttaceae bacterium]